MRRLARLGTLALLAASAAGGRAEDAGPRVRKWLDSGPSEKCLDIVFVGDGHVRADLGDNGKYWADVKRYAKKLTDDPPFCWYRNRTNVSAVFLESEEEGCAAAPYATHPRTALRAHFDSLTGGAGRKWAFEGGYYRDKGVVHPWLECRMRKHGDPFCPVCCEEVAKAIQAALGDPWDDAAWHAAHPLSAWR